MEKVIITISAVITAIFWGAVISFIIAVPIVNDNVAKDAAKKLSDIPLPEQTEYVESVSRAGKLVGNGNGMQYFGAILIKSEASLEELKAYYSNFADNEWECVVEPQMDKEIKDKGESVGIDFQSEISGDNFFIVYSWVDGGGGFHEFDLRGR